ncbi:hypothetical protein [Modestobacter versicolor]|uniref:Uncharacterized protein n=1 Tax=Modestobacter versicolor TaxID=429133 RepID=A0A323VW35_9ACTN|nr:hypothetical protein [Modestobacter versicolor]MBB3675173.1 hypothetical protein [Modestobacter versicolor]PZA23008.1 hypothetical protein DMO24_02290 [Modestobacter versicolor]
MSSDRPDPSEFFERAQQMMRELFGGASGGPEPWDAAARGNREPSPGQQRENLTFALATRAVEALEDLALNVAAIRQRLERTDGAAARPDGDDPPAPGAAPAGG